MSQHEILSSLPDETTNADAITLRSPVVQDGHALWQLVKRSGVLEENSCYAYVLLSTHFASTGVVAGSCGRIIGFVWRIGIDSAGGVPALARYPVFLAGRERSSWLGVRSIRFENAQADTAREY